MKLSRLHEQFIELANRPMSFGGLPVDPRKVELPVVAMNKWQSMGTPRFMTKTYSFRRPGDRNAMIRTLLEYEEDVQHPAVMKISEDSICLELITKNVDRVTELDKEYAAFADQVFKDIVISPIGAHSTPRL